MTYTDFERSLSFLNESAEQVSTLPENSPLTIKFNEYKQGLETLEINEYEEHYSKWCYKGEALSA